ncbi:MAG: uracil-DNA glycosylase [Verrucomicrobiota bacterium]
MVESELKDPRLVVAAYFSLLRDLGCHHVDLLPGWKKQIERIGEVQSTSERISKVQEPSMTYQSQSEEVPLSPASSQEVKREALSREEKQLALEEIRTELEADQSCREMFQYAKQMVFGVGAVEAKLVFIGEAPGVDEDEEGEPFVGKAGQLLTKMIQAMGLQREDVYITNVVKYRPDMPPGSKGNRKPTAEEMEAFRPYLMKQLEVIQPHALVALGATAVEGLLEIPKAGITSMRGNWKEVMGIPLMPTFHPAYILRNQGLSEKRKVWEDLLAVMEKIELPVSEKQRNYFL